jgi:hypothetical protein
MLKLAIIDEGYESRFMAFVNTFSAMEKVSLYSYRDGSPLQWDKELEEWIKIDEAPRCLLLLIHGGESYLKDVIPADKRIWFGGYIGKDRRIPAEEDSIYRAIELEDEVLNEEEAIEIIKYAQGKIQKPAFMRSPSYDEKVNRIISLIKRIVQSHTTNINWRSDLQYISKNSKEPTDPISLEKTLKSLIAIRSNQKEFFREIAKFRDDLLRKCDVAL